MVYLLDLTQEEFLMLEELLAFYPNLQNKTPEQKVAARNLLNYLKTVEATSKK